MKNKTIVIVTIIIIVLVIAGISILPKNDTSPVSVDNETGEKTRVASSFQAAPDFSLEELDGRMITIAEYKGKKPVILDFWATWCPNCQRDMPRLNGYYEKYKDQVEVIGVNLQENRSLVERFVKDRGITFPIVLDPAGVVTRGYEARYTNYHVLIDINGNIVKTIPGDIKESDIETLINQQ